MQFKRLKFDRSKGFTLIEMLVTISIAAILLSIAIPSFISLLKSWEARQIRTMVSDSYRLARSESLIHHQDVIVCLADMNKVCHRDAVDVILVFTDNNANKNYDANVDMLLSDTALDLDYGHTYLRASSRRHYFKFFKGTGTPRGNYGHIKYCPTDNDWNNMYQVSLNQLGIYRFKPRKTYDTDCP